MMIVCFVHIWDARSVKADAMPKNERMAFMAQNSTGNAMIMIYCSQQTGVSA